jgi:hypothetical protein
MQTAAAGVAKESNPALEKSKDWDRHGVAAVFVRCP